MKIIFDDGSAPKMSENFEIDEENFFENEKFSMN